MTSHKALERLASNEKMTKSSKFKRLVTEIIKCTTSVYVVLIVMVLIVTVGVSTAISVFTFSNWQDSISSFSDNIRTQTVNNVYVGVRRLAYQPIEAQQMMWGFWNETKLYEEMLANSSTIDRTDYSKFLYQAAVTYPHLAFLGFSLPRYGCVSMRVSNETVIFLLTNATLTAENPNLSVGYILNPYTYLPIFTAFTTPYSPESDAGTIHMGRVRAPLWSPLLVGPTGDFARGYQVPFFSPSGEYLNGFMMASFSFEGLQAFFMDIKPTKNARAFIIDYHGRLVCSNFHDDISYTVGEGATATKIRVFGEEAAKYLSDDMIQSASTYVKSLMPGNSWVAENTEADNGDNGFWNVSSLTEKSVTLATSHGKLMVDVMDISYDDQLRTTKFPLRFAGQKTNPLGWVIVLAIPEKDFTGAALDNLNTSIWLIVGFCIFSAMLGTATAVCIARPIRNMRNDMHRVARLEFKQSDLEKKRSKLAFSEIHSMEHTFESVKAVFRSFSKFVNKDVVLNIADSGEVARVTLERKECTVMFIDIEGSTTMGEALGDSEMLGMVLYIFFTEMSKIIIYYGGSVDKYIGDCIMAVWGAHKMDPQQQLNACRAAIACVQKLEEIRPLWAKLGAPGIKVRVGINSGNVNAGNVGADFRLNHTIIGDIVNVAAKLEVTNKKLGSHIVVSDSVFKGINNDPEVTNCSTSIGEVFVEGRKNATVAHTLNATKHKPINFEAIDEFGRKKLEVPPARALFDRVLDELNSRKSRAVSPENGKQAPNRMWSLSNSHNRITAFEVSVDMDHK